jgi:hypothetical protein
MTSCVAFATQETPLVDLLLDDAVASWHTFVAQSGGRLGNVSLAHFVQHLLTTSPTGAVWQLLDVDKPGAKALLAHADMVMRCGLVGCDRDDCVQTLLLDCVRVWSRMHSAPLGDGTTVVTTLPANDVRGAVEVHPVACARAPLPAGAGNASVRQAADVSNATAAISAALPPVADDMVRLFHGGPATRVSAVAECSPDDAEWQLSEYGDSGRGLFYVTPDLEYAVRHAILTFRDRELAPQVVALLVLDVPRDLLDGAHHFAPTANEWHALSRFGWNLMTRAAVEDVLGPARKKEYRAAVFVDNTGHVTVPPVQQFAFTSNKGLSFLRDRVLGPPPVVGDRDPRCRVMVMRAPVFE